MEKFEEAKQQLRMSTTKKLSISIPGLDKGKGLYFTPGGIPVRSDKSNDPFLDFTIPIETILCVDSFQRMYSQMLCGFLMREEVLTIRITFASILLQAIRFLQVNWKQLSNDIETGTLNHKIVTGPSVRECMSKILCKPNPELAEFINKEFEAENLERIIPRIWPHTKFLNTIVTGTMAQYIPTLDYYSGGLQLVFSLYASSECFFGLNLNPLCKPSEISYTILPNMGYFEFIQYKIDMDNSQPPISSESSPNLVDLANLEVGKKYEIVVTTYTGLCRYLLDDILQVTGFHYAAPQFKFVKRKNTLLSIHADKTSEEEIQKGIENAAVLLRPYNIEVPDYTCYADIKTIPRHYDIYRELLITDSTKNLSQNVLNECCLAIEESLNSLYIQYRKKGEVIGPLEIRVMKNGTFDKLMYDAISRCVSISQYKVPRCVNLPSIIEMLDSRLVSKHFSPIPPRSIHNIPPTLVGSTISDIRAIT